MTRRSRCALLALTLPVAITASACGSDDDSESGTGTAAETQGGETTTGSGTGPGTTGSGLGSGTDRTGETIKIGLVNEDEGVFAFPEYRIGAEVAFQAINDNGGINGATIELVSCSTDLTPEASIDCANQLVEANVVVAFTAIDLASDAALPIYQEAGIPYVTSNNWGDAQDSAEGSHLLHVATEGLFVGAFALADQLGITKVAYLYEQSPAQDNNVNNIIPPIARAFGLTVTDAGVDGAAPDWTAAVQTAEAAGAEMIYGLISEPGCTAMVQAIRDANFEGSIVAGACSDFQFELGDDAVGVYTLLDQLQPSAKDSAPASIAKNIEEYEQLMAAAGEERYAEGYAVWAYGAARELGTILASIEGPITAESAEAALDRDVTVPGQMGPDLNCGAAPWPDSPAHCSATIAVYQTGKNDAGEVVRTEVLPYFDAYGRLQNA